ncbi:hypothetical protein T03_10178, partial [Trichinella britovi]
LRPHPFPELSIRGSGDSSHRGASSGRLLRHQSTPSN